MPSVLRNPKLGTEWDAIRADYDAARDSRFRRKRAGVSTAAGVAADYHYRSEPRWLYMMELARDLFRNNAFVAQGVRRLVANVIQDGFTPDPKTGDDALNEDLSAGWWDWAEDREAVDLAGELTFQDAERLVFQQALVDGDHLVLPLRDGKLQFVEAHLCRTPRGKQPGVVHGVKLDAVRRRVSYWLSPDEIDPMAASPLARKMREVPARDDAGDRLVLHCYAPDRATQTRGVTVFAPVVDTAGMGDDLMFAQLVKAQSAACVTFLRELAEGATPGVPGQTGEQTSETRPDGTTRILEGLAPGLQLFGYPGEKITGFTPSIPNPEFFQHAMLILTIVAVNLDLPLAVLLLDPSKTNFSGWRGSIDQARLRFRQIQRWLVNVLHRPVWQWRIRQRMAEEPALRAAATKLGAKLFAHEWNPPTWPYIEPVNDAAGDILRTRNALTSQRRRCSERGMVWGDLTQEIVDDHALLIDKAAKKAAELNGANQDLNVTWREVISLPTPDSISLSVPVAPPAGAEPQPTNPPQGGDDAQR